MSAESAPCFLDTNVLVYAFDKSGSPKSRVSQQLIDTLMEQDALRTSTQVLQELFVLLTRKVPKPCTSAAAEGVLDSLAAWPVVTIDYPAIRAAIALADQARISFWDALAVTAAARCGASVLYTEDLNPGQTILGVRISNPFAAPQE